MNAHNVFVDLGKKINPLHLNPDMLVGRYIPNLIAKPFEVTKEYAQIIYDQTSSPRLDKVLRKWDEEDWDSAEQRQQLAYVILVELLAYQFASPVRWIETQDLLFTVHDFERFIEIGPSPTLTGMATRTLKAKYEAGDDSVSRTRAILCHAKNTKEVYYQFEDEAATENTPESATPTAPASPVAIQTPVVAAPAPAAIAANIEDAPVKSLEILTVIIAQKLKKPANEVPLSKSIKDLVGGKSTLQNEILGDLGQEFSSAPEKGEELPLEELGAALGVGFSGSLGKYTTGLVSRLIGGKMPGGFNLSAIKSYLSKSWGLGSQRADGVLLLGTTMEPAKRLGSEAEAKTWLDGVVALYAQRSGISLLSASHCGPRGGGGGAVMNSEEFLKYAVFAGHSLGERPALASVAGVLPISSLVDVVFYRGITMQRAVERDSANRSNYAMCAVNPSRISPSFNDSALREVVDDISRKTNCLLEIVNFNVEVCPIFSLTYNFPLNGRF